MVVEWTELATSRLRSVYDYYFYVAGRKVAQNIATNIVKSADSLSVMPQKAPVEQSLTGLRFTYRSLLVGKMFKVVYFVDEQADTIVISTIWDCRRNPADLQREVCE